MAHNIVNERYTPNAWNIYTFHCSDGENWKEDNVKAVDYMEKLINLSQLSGYIQIKGKQESMWGEEMAKVFEPLSSESFKVVKVSNKKDIWPEFSRLLGGKYEIQ